MMRTSQRKVMFWHVRSITYRGCPATECFPGESVRRHRNFALSNFPVDVKVNGRVEVSTSASFSEWDKKRHMSSGTALAEDSGLYQALKRAHSQKKYDVVRKWSSSPSAPTTLAPKDASIQSQVEQLLTELRPAMRRLVAGELTLPTWSPNATVMGAELAAHVEALRIPYLNGKPNVLLHDLGSFERDPALAARLKNIFMPNHHAFLVNTSGSGKTRLLLEGLCSSWGFYFTSLVDSSLLGSTDVQNSIRLYIPDSPGFKTTLPALGSLHYESAVSRNRVIANRIFSQLFLARLIVFDLFVEVMNELKASDDTRSTVYKQRWLLLQLRPSLIHTQIWDIFDDLTVKFADVTDSYINGTTKALLARVRKLCVDKTPSGTPTISTHQTPIFCVLDEAQYAATQHCMAFRSDDGSANRPVLREIVRAWEGQSSGQGVFMVVAGTGISKDVVDRAMSSAIMKESKYRWCSDTGAFDDLEIQRRYIEKYLPPSLLSTASGKRLLDRIGYWLHGRHRFTAGYIAELLNNDFQRPHTLLNTYIEHFTDFRPTDAQDFVDAEGPAPVSISSRYKLDFHKLTKNPDMIATIHQITTHYLMRSVLPGSLGKDEKTYVEYGFARFVDAETNTVAVDEPLVLLAATRWIDANYRSSYKFFAKQIHVHEPASNGFENYLAFCLNLAFSQKHRLDEVFSFLGAAPSWAHQEVELVALHRTSLEKDAAIEINPVRHSSLSGPSLTLGLNAKTTEETSAWLRHESHAPICFPHASMGPDLLFVLRLADGPTLWVALQAKYSTGKNGTLSRLFLRRAMRSVTPSKFFIDKEGKPFSPTTDPDLVNATLEHLGNLPHRRADAGKYSLLRVVASFPAQPGLKRCSEEDPDDEGHPIAALNMRFIKQLTRALSPVDFLEGLERTATSSQVVGKRTRKGSGLRPAPTKRLKI
ncbi:putative expressed protein [Lyophyllum shimeji]|uniref:Expressed protein n=1 Tax=Lyophyllum shimeji TaxID=47721 RepID=A0A9P3PWU3_LYOSH|nr:putative expressed protein [Lyophyllum shimeji]